MNEMKISRFIELRPDINNNLKIRSRKRAILIRSSYDEAEYAKVAFSKKIVLPMTYFLGSPRSHAGTSGALPFFPQLHNCNIVVRSAYLK